VQISKHFLFCRWTDTALLFLRSSVIALREKYGTRIHIIELASDPVLGYCFLWSHHVSLGKSVKSSINLDHHVGLPLTGQGDRAIKKVARPLLPATPTTRPLTLTALFITIALQDKVPYVLLASYTGLLTPAFVAYSSTTKLHLDTHCVCVNE